MKSAHPVDCLFFKQKHGKSAKVQRLIDKESANALELQTATGLAEKEVRKHFPHITQFQVLASFSNLVAARSYKF